MSDQEDIIVDDNYDNYENPIFYDVSLCFTFMDMDDCVTFEMVSDGEIEDNIALVDHVIDGYNGVAEMEDGTIINLRRYVNAFVVKSDDQSTKPVNSKFTLVH